MGSFLGHLAPGSFFIAFALWWTYSIFKRYFQSVMNRNNQPYQSTAAFTSRTSKIPLEPLLKLGASVIGIIGEAITGFDSDWNYDNIMNNIQHILMFSFYLMNSISDLAVYYKVRHVPPNIDYLFAIMAIFNEGFLFANHLHGRSILDVKLHLCLVVSIGACFLATVIELFMDKSDVRPAIFRCVCHLWQGTWFYHIAFVLYPPPGFHAWETDNHANAMITVSFFMVHLAFNVIFVFIISILVYLKEKKNNNSAKYKPTSSSNGLSNGLHHARLENTSSDNEEEELFLNAAC
jgi:hypothetical protein